ncbi:hypothetical protein GCM10020254_22330 [Streptomyces goshikiensis]
MTGRPPRERRHRPSVRTPRTLSPPCPRPARTRTPAKTPPPRAPSYGTRPEPSSPLGRRRVRRPPPLRLAKALHRLSRSVPARDRLELDEERTARHGIADGLWIPYLRPAAEKAFDLVLLVDSAPTMRIWEDRVAAIAVEAARSGAFRDVRTVRLELPRYGTARLRWSGGAPAIPRRCSTPGGRGSTSS